MGTPLSDLRGVGRNIKEYITQEEGISFVEDLFYLILRKVHQHWSKNEIEVLLFARLLPPRSPVRNDYIHEAVRDLFERLDDYDFDNTTSIVGRHLTDAHEVHLEENGCHFCRREPQRFFGCGHGVCNYCYLERQLEPRFTTDAHDPVNLPHLTAAPEVVVCCHNCGARGPARPL